MYLELVQAFEWVHSDRFRDLRKLLAFNEKDELNPLILALVELLAPHYMDTCQLPGELTRVCMRMNSKVFQKGREQTWSYCMGNGVA